MRGRLGCTQSISAYLNSSFSTHWMAPSRTSTFPWATDWKTSTSWNLLCSTWRIFFTCHHRAKMFLASSVTKVRQRDDTPRKAFATYLERHCLSGPESAFFAKPAIWRDEVGDVSPRLTSKRVDQDDRPLTAGWVSDDMMKCWWVDVIVAEAMGRLKGIYSFETHFYRQSRGGVSELPRWDPKPFNQLFLEHYFNPFNHGTVPTGYWSREKKLTSLRISANLDGIRSDRDKSCDPVLFLCC